MGSFANPAYRAMVFLVFCHVTVTGMDVTVTIRCVTVTVNRRNILCVGPINAPIRAHIPGVHPSAFLPVDKCERTYFFAFVALCRNVIKHLRSYLT